MQHASQDAAPDYAACGPLRMRSIIVVDGNSRMIGTTAEFEIRDSTSTTLIGLIVTRELKLGTCLRLPVFVLQAADRNLPAVRRT